MEDRYYTISELSEYLRVTKATIYKWIQKGKFPEGILLGNARRITGAEVSAWLAAQGQK